MPRRDRGTAVRNVGTKELKILELHTFSALRHSENGTEFGRSEPSAGDRFRGKIGNETLMPIPEKEIRTCVKQVKTRLWQIS